jgi:hypothetical protein
MPDPWSEEEEEEHDVELHAKGRGEGAYGGEKYMQRKNTQGKTFGRVLLIVRVLGSYRLQYVLRLRSRSINVSETIEESLSMKFHLK